ncbi:hypothetical protein [Dyella ginsengisoli]|uniref:hypothetical protein n=1 Tax=Dyella ginsengisoli TaxID=363848 RepID=UPI000376D040|nr:hypothetical protein [Dyella ginsengisoli]
MFNPSETTNHILVINHGPELMETNYYDTENAQAGFIFASWNAGALRILIPDNQTNALAEMLTAENIAVTRGYLGVHDAYEILFDDGTVCPFVAIIDARNSDHNVGRESHGKPLAVYIYTREGCLGVFEGRFRVAPLPCLQPMNWLPLKKRRAHRSKRR